MDFERSLPFLVLLLFPIFFGGLWVGVCFLISALGGWSRLAVHYESQSTFRGKTWHFQSARLWLANYNGCLTIGADNSGLYLKVFPLFRVGHPPLLIPWYDVTTTQHKGLLFTYLDFTFAKSPSVKFRVTRKLGERIKSVQTDSSFDI